MSELGSWYYDLARRWDGAFLNQSPYNQVRMAGFELFSKYGISEGIELTAD